MLDTSDRSDMMRILMQLRGKTYPSTGDYVMARIRASIVTHSMVDVYSTLPTADTWANAAVQQLPKKKKKKRRTKSVKTKSASKATLSNSILVATKPQPPLLTEHHFPSLLDDKVEWATTPVEADDSVGEREDDESEESTKHDGGEDEEERKSAKALSDAASTATTTSSNVSSGGFDSVSKKQAVGDYAAALLKAPASKTTVPAVAVRETQAPKPRKPSSSDSDEKMAPDPVVITSPLTWGGGRSFADMLRKKDAQSQREKQ